MPLEVSLSLQKDNFKGDLDGFLASVAADTNLPIRIDTDQAKGALRDVQQEMRRTADAAESLFKRITAEEAVSSIGDLKDILTEAIVPLAGLSEETENYISKAADMASAGAGLGLIFGPLGALFGGVVGGALGILAAESENATKKMEEQKKAEEDLRKETERLKSKIDDLIKSNERLGRRTELTALVANLAAVSDNAEAAEEALKKLRMAASSQLGLGYRDDLSDDVIRLDSRLEDLKKKLSSGTLDLNEVLDLITDINTQGDIALNTLQTATDTAELALAARDYEHLRDVYQEARDLQFELLSGWDAPDPKSTPAVKAVKEIKSELDLLIESATDAGRLLRSKDLVEVTAGFSGLDLGGLLRDLQSDLGEKTFEPIELELPFTIDPDGMSEAFSILGELEGRLIGLGEVAKENFADVVADAFSELWSEIEAGGSVLDGLKAAWRETTKAVLQSIGEQAIQWGALDVLRGWALVFGGNVAQGFPLIGIGLGEIALGATLGAVGAAAARTPDSSGGVGGGGSRPGGVGSDTGFGQARDPGPITQTPTIVYLGGAPGSTTIYAGDSTQTGESAKVALGGLLEDARMAFVEQGGGVR